MDVGLRISETDLDVRVDWGEHVLPSEMPPVDSVLAIHRDGVGAIVEITRQYSRADWRLPSPCDGWSATDLAGHVLTVFDTWHLLLDDSEARAPAPRFAWNEMDAYYSDRLAELPHGSGPERISQFVERADEYFDRVAALDPELPLVSGFPDVTTVPISVGLFTWFGGIEWHVHAWDFARTIGRDYRTAHAATLREAATVVFGGSDDDDPWEALVGSLRPDRDRT